MDRRFSCGNISFDYSLLLERRKTISATVFPTQALLVKVPSEATDDRIDDFLKRKLRWILQQQRYFAQFKARAERRGVSGETLCYRGRAYKLLLRRADSDERVSLQHGIVTVFLLSPKTPSRARRLLDAWYKERAHKVLSDRLAACFSLFGYKELPFLVIRRLNKRWGSYLHKTNKIVLNQELIKASTRYIDYVIVHELCHVNYRRHSRAFYSLLKSKFPQWEKLKTELELRLLG